MQEKWLILSNTSGLHSRNRSFHDVLVELERRTVVGVSLKSEEVGHGRHGVVHDHVHALVMNCLEHFAVLLDVAKVVVQDSVVVRAESVHLPGLIQQQATGDVDATNSHAMQVVQRVFQAHNIASMSKLCPQGSAYCKALASSRRRDGCSWIELVLCNTHVRSLEAVQRKGRRGKKESAASPKHRVDTPGVLRSRGGTASGGENERQEKRTVASNRRLESVVDRTLPTLPVTGCDRSNLVNAIFDSQRGRPTTRTSHLPSRRKNLVLSCGLGARLPSPSSIGCFTNEIIWYSSSTVIDHDGCRPCTRT
ncbi:hypothetical protein KC361_g117 [Hortaea werneckii]|nr:hypothetical protein KC361_g117 [Hortaea werneckii]